MLVVVCSVHILCLIRFFRKCCRLVLSAWFQNATNDREGVKHCFNEAIISTTNELGFISAHRFLVLQCLIVNAWGDPTLRSMLNGTDMDEAAG